MNSPFSLFLAGLIEESGLGKNSIIRSTGINRSTFFKFLNGSRIPTHAQYKDIKRVLPLSAADVRKLDELYEFETVGVDAAINRKAVLSCFEIVADYEDVTKTCISFVQGGVPTRLCEFQSGKQAFDQKHEVISLLANFFERQYASGEPKFDAFLPRMEDSFYARINMMALQSKIRHADARILLQFPKKKAGESTYRIVSSYNNILLFTVWGFSGFRSFYFYDDNVIEDNCGVLYPYFIADDSEVILVGSKCSGAVRIQDPVLVKQFRKQIDGVFCGAHEAKVKADDLNAVFDAVQEFGSLEVNCWNYGGMANLLMLMDEEEMKRIPELRPYAARVRETLDFVEQKQLMTEFLSMDGLRRFAYEGAGFFLPFSSEYSFSLEERIDMLKKIDTSLGEVYYILDEMKVPIIKNWVITVVEGHAIAIARCGKIEAMAMKEQNLISVFSDFMSSLPLSDQVLPIQVAHRNIQKLIHDMETKLLEQDVIDRRATG